MIAQLGKKNVPSASLSTSLLLFGTLIRNISILALKFFSASLKEEQKFTN